MTKSILHRIFIVYSTFANYDNSCLDISQYFTALTVFELPNISPQWGFATKTLAHVMSKSHSLTNHRSGIPYDT